MKNRKRTFMCMLLMALCVVAGVAGTYAYLHATTNTCTNVFASDKRITIQLREPLWDGYEFTDSSTKNGAGINDTLPVTKQEELGYVLAKSYVPGQVIPKNPTVKNNGTTQNEVPVYTAVKVQYYDQNGKELTYAQFKNMFLTSDGIDFDTANWTKLQTTGSTYDVYQYNSVLNTATETTPLFTKVPLSYDIQTNADGSLPEFKIQVTAYAIQSQGIAADSINVTMLNFIKANN